MRLFRPWPVAGLLYPGSVFRLNTGKNEVCLTFDDGPDPLSTPAILDILGRYNVKAVFFCTGSRAEKHPGLMDNIRQAGHIPGNHGYNHPNGFKTSIKNYVADIQKADNLTSSYLFRPPYGRITPWQYKLLRKQYSIWFWDLMPYDFDSSFGPERSLNVLKKKLRPGSLIVLHDSHLSCAGKILEDLIIYCHEAGYEFSTGIQPL